jgi:hypothetical protein
MGTAAVVLRAGISDQKGAMILLINAYPVVVAERWSPSESVLQTLSQRLILACRSCEGDIQYGGSRNEGRGGLHIGNAVCLRSKVSANKLGEVIVRGRSYEVPVI